MGDGRKWWETSICLSDERSKHHNSKKCTNIKESSLVFKKQYYSTVGENIGLGYEPDNRESKIKFNVLQRVEVRLSSRKERKLWWITAFHLRVLLIAVHYKIWSLCVCTYVLCVYACAYPRERESWKDLIMCVSQLCYLKENKV